VRSHPARWYFLIMIIRNKSGGLGGRDEKWDEEFLARLRTADQSF
jgi:hypothetical protein